MAIQTVDSEWTSRQLRNSHHLNFCIAMRLLPHRRHIRARGCGVAVCSLVVAVTAISLFASSILLLAQVPSRQASQEDLPRFRVSATVTHLKLLLDDGPPAIEIITTAPVTPAISKLADPMRLVIDLPNTNMSVSHKQVPVQGEDISSIRLELNAANPPTVHVEVDLRKPMDYTWESAGNRLLVRLHAIDLKLKPASAPIAPVDLGNVVPVDRLASGASITASSDTTVLRLRHGGDFFVCPRTTVAVTHSRSGPDMMLALSTGALEAHVTLDNSADEVITPDFRILLRGPGKFDYAIRADSQGNTCVRTLPGNTSSAIIYELQGDGKFEFQPRDQIIFHSGRLSPEDTALHLLPRLRCFWLPTRMRVDDQTQKELLPLSLQGPPRPPKAKLHGRRRQRPNSLIREWRCQNCRYISRISLTPRPRLP